MIVCYPHTEKYSLILTWPKIIWRRLLINLMAPDQYPSVLAGVLALEGLLYPAVPRANAALAPCPRSSQ